MSVGARLAQSGGVTQAAAGLSERTQQLWLMAMHHRKLADELAQRTAR